ncbi:MAG: sulfurase [Fibrobacteres bacterium]|nr:sulfurase [Fibrobacterota bacterium]
MIKAIYISKTRDGHIESPHFVEVIAGKGIVGDRYFDDFNRKSPDYEITFIEAEKVDLFNETSNQKIEYWEPRRNIVTIGADLISLIGVKFRIGSAAFEGLESCEPCELFRTRTSSAAFKWFYNKAGLRARVIESGGFQISDPILPEQ